jgi:2'-5' RNA ligase
LDLVRAFIAIDLPEHVRRELGRQIDRLREVMPRSSVRWVRPDGIHLTLRFLGDTDPGRVPELAGELEGVARIHPAFSITVGGLGCFPNLTRPRVLWVGVEEEVGVMKRLQAGVEAVCCRLGYKAEQRGFSPHLTLGRVRQGGEAKVGEAFARVVEADGSRALGEAQVEEIVLFQSELRPDGAIYRRLATARLGQA